MDAIPERKLCSLERRGHLVQQPVSAIISGLRRDAPSTYLDKERMFCQRHCVAANCALDHIRQSREGAANGTPVGGDVQMAPRTDPSSGRPSYTATQRACSRPIMFRLKSCINAGCYHREERPRYRESRLFEIFLNLLSKPVISIFCSLLH